MTHRTELLSQITEFSLDSRLPGSNLPVRSKSDNLVKILVHGKNSEFKIEILRGEGGKKIPIKKYIQCRTIN